MKELSNKATLMTTDNDTTTENNLKTLDPREATRWKAECFLKETKNIRENVLTNRFVSPYFEAYLQELEYRILSFLYVDDGRVHSPFIELDYEIKVLNKRLSKDFRFSRMEELQLRRYQRRIKAGVFYCKFSKFFNILGGSFAWFIMKLFVALLVGDSAYQLYQNVGWVPVAVILFFVLINLGSLIDIFNFFVFSWDKELFKELLTEIRAYLKKLIFR